MEITVIQDQPHGADLRSMTSSERRVVFDQLIDKYGLPREVVSSFFALNERAITDELRYDRPELRELLLRKLISFANPMRMEYPPVWSRDLYFYNTLIIPIIPTISPTLLRAQQLLRDRALAVGGAPRAFRNMRVAKVPVVEVPHSVRVRFDTAILAATEDGMSYIVPPNEEIAVIGVIINPVCAAPQT